LRSFVAPNWISEQTKKLQPKLVGMHQWGPALPGGCGALIHRRCYAIGSRWHHPIASLPRLGPQKHARNHRWPSIRATINKHLTAEALWTAWSHTTPATMVLPSGAGATFNRGAMQAEVRAKAYSDFVCQHPNSPTTGVCDEWFIDDGPVFILLQLFHDWLVNLDATLAEMGATRSRKPEKITLQPSFYARRGKKRRAEGGTRTMYAALATSLFATTPPSPWAL
jgi:hypothetical protein